MAAQALSIDVTTPAPSISSITLPDAPVEAAYSQLLPVAGRQGRLYLGTVAFTGLDTTFVLGGILLLMLALLVAFLVRRRQVAAD